MAARIRVSKVCDLHHSEFLMRFQALVLTLDVSMGFEYKQKRQDYYLGVAGMREDAWVFSLKHR